MTRIWAVGYASTQIWDFSSSSYFSKIPNLKLFDNWWGNSYTKFAILDIKCSFSFENEWVLYWNVLTFLSNMTKIVRKKKQLEYTYCLISQEIKTFIEWNLVN